MHEIEDTWVKIDFVSPRLRHGPFEVASIGLGRRACIDIGAVNREAGDDLAQGAMQDIVGEVGGARVLPRNPGSIAASTFIRSPSRVSMRSFISGTICANGADPPVNWCKCG